MARSDEELRDGCLRKLEAEASIGVLAALVAGCALAVLGADSDFVLEPKEAAALHPLFGVLVYAHVLALSLVAGAGMINVVSTSTLYWAGMKIFSKRKGTQANDLRVFDVWWDGIKSTRQLSRHAFLYSVPLFLFAMATSPGLWRQSAGLAGLNALVMGLSACGCFVCTSRLVLTGAPKQDLGKEK